MVEHQDNSSGDMERLLPCAMGLAEQTRLHERLILLNEKFRLKFNNKPQHYIRVPGRVNLIGEHIDYCGYSVCPMALQQDLLVAFQTTKAEKFLSIINGDTDKYKDYSAENHSFNLSLATTGWASYFLCGVRAVTELLAQTNFSPVPMQIAVTGNIPPCSGLSSSSALVCAGVLVTALANKVELSKNQLASLSAEAEQYIGTVGGGMDQAIIFLASGGCAKLIDFNPLRTRDVNLPEGAVFVVAHSLVTKNKAASNDFNTRVVECRLAAQILAKIKNLSWKKCLRLADFQTSVSLKLEKAIELVGEVLHAEPYSKPEVCQILGVTKEQLNKLTLTPNTEDVEEFKLFQRAMHVFQEAGRVCQWEEGCRRGCDLSTLGQLMSSSHNSLRDLYECSHPQLDRLVSVALDAGALGARLTGAGWGGCVVALLSEDKIDQFVSRVSEQFYVGNPQAEGLDINNLIFVTEPAQGVQLFHPQHQ